MDDTTIDERFTGPFWDERYGAADRIWSGNPNPQLVAEASDLPPGRALDAGCGEGADAHWLARRGWNVTAVDVSAVALDRAARHAAAEFAERIDWQHVDLTRWTPQERSFDLVSAQFIHFPSGPREPIFAGFAAAVAPGGTLLIVGHHPSDLAAGIPRPPEPELFYTAEEIASALAPEDWEVVVADSRPRSVTDPEGRELTVQDAVMRARRRQAR